MSKNWVNIKSHFEGMKNVQQNTLTYYKAHPFIFLYEVLQDQIKNENNEKVMFMSLTVKSFL